MTRHIEIWKVDGKYQVEADVESGPEELVGSGMEVLMVLNSLSELEQLMDQAANWVEHEQQQECPY